MDGRLGTVEEVAPTEKGAAAEAVKLDRYRNCARVKTINLDTVYL